MRMAEARNLGRDTAALLAAGNLRQAHSLLAPVLAERTPFPVLGVIGAALGTVPLHAASTFLDQIAASRTDGGWVVIGSALRGQLEHDLAGAFARCRHFVVLADIWYASDILGERVPGPALLTHFAPSLAQLTPWREDGSRWVRRAVGVAVHLWAKRSQGDQARAQEARTLLSFLEPLLAEQELDAVKGIGWGLKTLGKHYPAMVTDWLELQLARGRRPSRALMLRKAVTYLSEEQRSRLPGAPA